VDVVGLETGGRHGSCAGADVEGDSGVEGPPRERGRAVREIDITSWPRREHFAFFRGADLPFYNVNVQVDITGLPLCAKERSLSLTSTLLHVTMRSLNAIENFRYRIRGDAVVLHDVVHPSFAHLKDGDELFSLVTVDYSEDVVAFDEAVRDAIRESTTYFDLSVLTGRDDLVFVSPMPWIAFTAVDHTLSLNRDDAIPRVTWGKHTERAGRTLLPFNIQVNHACVDGLHVARFFEGMDRALAEFFEA
jgi:chloramphenicol O-acetyltransferase type A